VLAGLSAAADTRAKNPWEDPAVNAFNRLPARTYAMPLADDAAAFTDDLEPATPFVKSLNGDDLNRASPPVYTENEEPVITEENIKFVFHLPNGETLEAINGSESDPEVVKASKAIADKVAELCGNIHPKQLSNVYYALSQSALSVNVNGGFLAHGISSNEHMAVTFTLSRDDETGAVTIKYSEPKDFPVKFSWTTTIDVEGKSTTTPMRIEDRADGAR
ncbi:MAG: hypothetical protein IKQ17_10445, partial [Kiritimatiellae bacterium]|nr:hypothetical protein [Kiritimatiellia bacterium]